MIRPLMQKRIDQLEELFRNSNLDAKDLKQLERELQHRQVPRAVTLLGKVQSAITATAGLSSPVNAPAQVPTTPEAKAPTPPSPVQQPELWDGPIGPAVKIVPAAPAAPAVRTIKVVGRKQDTDVEKATTPTPTSKPTFLMTLDDAYKLLQTTPSSTWESIERTRQHFVQLSHPTRLMALAAGERKLALEYAGQINAAYGLLSQARCKGP